MNTKTSFLKPNFFVGIALGAVTTAALILLKVEFLATLGHQRPYSLLLISILAATAYGGYAAGLLTTAFSMAATIYLFVPQYSAFHFVRSADETSALIFLFQAIFSVLVVHQLLRQQAALKVMEQEGEQAKRMAEKRLREIEMSERRYKALIDSNIIGVTFWKNDGLITDANQAFLDMVGYNENELLNEKINWRDMTPKKYKKMDDQRMRDVYNDGISPPFQKEYIRKDGSAVPILIAAAIREDIPDGGVAYVIDLSNQISLRKRKK
jgi:PAS domain S-box-containing protein